MARVRSTILATVGLVGAGLAGAQMLPGSLVGIILGSFADRAGGHTAT